jgi:Tol biopolymer transport system component
MAQQLSPNGKWAFASIPTSPMQPVLYPTGAGEPVKLERGNIEAYEAGAFWFPDGQRILFCGIEAGRGSRIYVQQVPDGKPQPITPEGTRLGALSPDGKLVLARNSDLSWALYPIQGGAPRPVPGLTAREESIRWSTDGQSVYVYNPRQIPSPVERFTRSTGRRDLLMTLGTENRTGLTRVVWVSISDNEHAYAYSCYRMLSTLFVVDGAQ